MANFFDQFDPPPAQAKQDGGGNYFDQFDAPAPPAGTGGDLSSRGQGQKEPVGVVEDVARTVPAGLVRGTIGGFNGPDDLLRMGADKAISGAMKLIPKGEEPKDDALVGYVDPFPGYKAPTSLWGRFTEPSPEYVQKARERAMAEAQMTNRDLAARQAQDRQSAFAAAEKTYGLKPGQVQEDMPQYLGGGGVTNTQRVMDDVESVTGPLYRPQTTVGKYANTIAEFAPSAVLMPGGLANKAVQTVAPALVSEAAGQATEGTAAEPYARMGGALAGGLAAARYFAPSTAEQMALSRMGNVSDKQLSLAEGLMQSAKQQGIDLTLPEAVAQASGGRTTLPALQRVVEHTPGQGGEIMRDFMANRPGQIETAGRAAFDRIAPEISAPSSIGPQIRGAADNAIGDVRRSINAQTQPLYEAARDVQLPNKQFVKLMQDPVYMEGYNQTYKNPYMRGEMAKLDPRSVGMVDEVKKTLGAKEKGLLSEINPNRDARTAEVIGSARREMTDIARQASPEYGMALDAQATLREKYLQPLMEGPLGKLAKKDTTTQSAINALFPSNPLPGMNNEVAQTMASLAAKNPVASRALVRAHAEQVFNEATQKLATGANEFGGAKYVANLLGNPEQKAVFQAAVENGMKDGKQVWQGFDRFAQALEATGQRMQAGSPTSFIAKELKDIGQGGKGAAAIDSVKTLGVKAFDRLNGEYMKMRLNGDLKGLAKLFTDPEAVKRLRTLAAAPPKSAQALALATRLMIIANQKSSSGR